MPYKDKQTNKNNKQMPRLFQKSRQLARWHTPITLATQKAGAGGFKLGSAWDIC